MIPVGQSQVAHKKKEDLCGKVKKKVDLGGGIEISKEERKEGRKEGGKEVRNDVVPPFCAAKKNFWFCRKRDRPPAGKSKWDFAVDSRKDVELNCVWKESE